MFLKLRTIFEKGKDHLLAAELAALNWNFQMHHRHMPRPSSTSKMNFFAGLWNVKVGHKPISLRVEMAAYSVVFLVCLFQIGFALDPSKTAMNIHQVVPDVIDVAPTNTISIQYDSGVSVAEGNELTPTQVQNQPIKVEWPVEEGALYTLCLTGC